MSFKGLKDKVKETLRGHRSRSHSPALRNGPLQSLSSVRVSKPAPDAPSSFSQDATTGPAEATQNRHSLPILTISTPAPDQESGAQDPPAAELDADLSPGPSHEGGEGKQEQAPFDELWDRAYDGLKSEDQKLVEDYERILTRQLLTPAEAEAVENGIEQRDKKKRRVQMQQLIEGGLNKISGEAKWKTRIGNALPVVNLSKSIVTEAIKGVPQAALPWAAVSLLLELLANPLSQADDNRKGLTHVVNQMEWYCGLAALVLGDQDGITGKLQEQLRARLIDLYKKLLSFEIKSICSYYHHRGWIFLQDLVKLDDWKGTLKEIQEDEAFFHQQFQALQSIDLGRNVEQLVVHAKSEQEYRKTEKDMKCLRDLYITDPREDKRRIESTKGGLVQDSWRWVLQHRDYRTWLKDDDKRLLWIKGDPGKGKTMLLCGLVDHITQRVAQSGTAVSFFFCQATMPTLNNHLAVLRSLIWLLADQQPFLISHFQEQYDSRGKDLFEGPNAWYSLKPILSSILRDERLTTTYLIIDGLDECATGLSELLEFIKEALPLQNVKWIISSRNWPKIRDSLEDTPDAEGVNLSLEVNAALVADAVDAYISEKASTISFLKGNDALREEVCNLIRERANGTFLWVAIVFQQLQRKRFAYGGSISIMERLKKLPEGLTKLYDRMLQQIETLDDREESDLCRTALGICVLAYEPIRLQELATLAGFKHGLTELSELQILIETCGSFLTVKDETVYFIHQSSKDYLTTNERAQSTLFPDGSDDVHHKMVAHSLEAMDQRLCRNIYKLHNHAMLIDEITTPEPDPLVSLRYPCSHWLRHLCVSMASIDLSDGKVLKFLQKHILHWLEVMSLLGNPSGGIPYVIELEQLLKQRAPNSELFQLVHDIRRFTQHNWWIINNAPLQIYLSAIMFSPKRSIVRTLFEEELLSWIAVKPITDDHWSPCLQTIDVPTGNAIALSNDRILARVLPGHNLELRNVISGKQIRQFENKEDIWQILFSSDSKRVVATHESGVVSWEVASGIAHYPTWSCGHEPSMSNDGKFIASHTSDGAIQIQDMDTGEQLSLVEDHYRYSAFEQRMLTLSNGAKFLAFGRDNVTIWDVTADAVNTVIRIGNIGKMCFSSDSEVMAYVSGSIKIWNLSERCPVAIILEGANAYGETFASLAFSADSKLLAGGSRDYIWIWDVATGSLLTRLETKGGDKSRLSWSPDSEILASVEFLSIRVWDLTTFKIPEPTSGIRMDMLGSLIDGIIAVNNDYTLVATALGYRVAVWVMTTGSELARFDDRELYDMPTDVRFLPDSRLLTISLGRGNNPTLTIWDMTTGSTVSPAFLGDLQDIYRYAISGDGKYLAAAGKALRIWNMSTCEATLHFTVDGEIMAMAFSNNGRYLSLLTSDQNVAVWDVTTGDQVKRVRSHVCGKEKCRICSGKAQMAVAVSDNARRIVVCAIWTVGLRIEPEAWILNEGQTIRLTIGEQCFTGRFGVRESYIATSRGYIDLNGLQTGCEALASYETITYKLRFEGYGLSPDTDWITWNGSNLLWLPTTYRPFFELAIVTPFPPSVFVVSYTGNVLIFRFTGPPPI